MKLKHILFIVLGLAIGILLVRFGAAVVMAAALPLLKIALPLVVAYLGVRYLRTKLQELGGDNQAQSRRRVEAIDICPECGEVMAGEHRCRQSKS